MLLEANNRWRLRMSTASSILTAREDQSVQNSSCSGRKECAMDTDVKRERFTDNEKNGSSSPAGDMRPKSRARCGRAVLIIPGILCTALGALGAVLPVLPATPFLLAAAFCFARSSERLSRWLCATKLYQSHLETVRCGEGMTRAAKIHIIAAVTAVMGLSEFFMLRAYLLKGSQGARIGCIVMAVVWAAHVIAFGFIMKTCPEERAEEIARECSTKGEAAYDAE